MAYQLEVLDLLNDLNERGRTIIMVLHDLNHACRYAHHIVAMRKGVIMAQGTPQEVMTPELIQEVFQLNCRIVPDPISGTPLCVPIGRKHQSAAPAANGRTSLMPTFRADQPVLTAAG
jgi:iron complex transport system ATP-binding protein